MLLGIQVSPEEGKREKKIGYVFDILFHKGTKINVVV